MMESSASSAWNSLQVDFNAASTITRLREAIGVRVEQTVISDERTEGADEHTN